MANNFKQHLDAFIDSNILGWENVLCLVCGKNADYECAAPCPVALACTLRDSLTSNTELNYKFCVTCSGFKADCKDPDHKSRYAKHV